MPAITLNQREVSRRICKALDLDPGKVRSIEIKLYPNEVVSAEVVLSIQDDQFELLCLELDQCTFIEKGER
jgi:hypothetical protein